MMHEFSKNSNDLDLAAACSQGDRRAQRILFERVKNPMFGICMRFAESRAAAEDLLQVGFIRVFRDIARYRGEGSLDGWVRRVFVRTAIEDYHRRKKLPQIVELDQLENFFFEPEYFDPDDPDAVIALLQKLPPGFRTVLNLAVLEEKSHEEIAHELGITASTSRSQLARAKAFLKKIVQKKLVLI
ncbi:MAG: sigma-70 family RNA polymerase sigma factor [Saprospiraceae bacterium]|nr:sigma-70 family RNA polymerase sigma factor [Saprospiraceae bacterium]